MIDDQPVTDPLTIANEYKEFFASVFTTEYEYMTDHLIDRWNARVHKRSLLDDIRTSFKKLPN